MTRNDDDIEQMYRLMCFNFASHNCDDHAKNFSYYYDEESDTWHLTPAYDLTLSDFYNGEHMSAAGGNGRRLTDDFIHSLAGVNGISTDRALKINEEIIQICHSDLSEYI